VDHDANSGNDARIGNKTIGQNAKEVPVVIVAASQRALLEVSTGLIYRAMFGEGVDSRECDEHAMFQSIEDCPIVREREGVMKCLYAFRFSKVLNNFMDTACDATLCSFTGSCSFYISIL
jgi:hypothetical protein